MARTKMNLGGGLRLSDYLSFGIMSEIVPLDSVKEVLERCGKQEVRRRKLPSDLMVYYVIALALYSKVSLKEVLRCVLEGARRAGMAGQIQMASAKSSISNARRRIGQESLELLFDKVTEPAALPETRGAWYRDWRLVGIDGSTLEVPDEKENATAFGRPGASRGKAAFPRIRFSAIFEIGTKIVFSAAMDKYATQENALAKRIVHKLRPGMLCIADRYYSSYNMFSLMSGTGADLLVRARKNSKFKCIKRFRDGSFLSKIYPDLKSKRRDENGTLVRVIEYHLHGVENAEEKYILVTTILDPKKAPAKELAALYHERWEVEIAYDELKTHLKEPSQSLRSKRPDLVAQEFYGYMLAHFVIRKVMHRAALKGERDPDDLSFVHAVRVIRRKMISKDVFSLDEESGGVL